MSGSSQGWPGAPLRLWYANDHGKSPDAIGNQRACLVQLRRVLAAVRHRNRDAVGCKNKLGLSEVMPRNICERLLDPIGNGLNEARMIEKWSQFHDRRSSGTNPMRARSMSSRY